MVCTACIVTILKESVFLFALATRHDSLFLDFLFHLCDRSFGCSSANVSLFESSQEHLRWHAAAAPPKKEKNL
jgi:hypothetical protein